MKRGALLAVVVALIAISAAPRPNAAWRAATEPYAVVSATKQAQQELCMGPAAQHARVVQSAAHGKLRVFANWSRLAIDRGAAMALEGFDDRRAAWLPDQRAAIRRVCRRRCAPPAADPLSS